MLWIAHCEIVKAITWLVNETQDVTSIVGIIIRKAIFAIFCQQIVWVNAGLKK